MKRLGGISCAVITTIALIFACFLHFRAQVDSYVEADMRTQIEAIQNNSILLIQNEMNYLKRVTASAALILSRAETNTDAEILETLEGYAKTSDIVRTLFITLDGHAYTSYAGDLGQSDKNRSIDGTPLSEITEPIFSQPYYAEDLGEVVFGVVVPCVMGEKAGVLVSSYNMKAFSTMLDNKLAGSAAGIGIINSKGEVVNGQSVEEFQINIFDSLSGVAFLSSTADTMREDFANGKSGFAIYIVDNITRYCTYAPIGLNDWYAIVMIKEDVLRSKLAQPEQYGFQLTVELVSIMLGLLFVIVAISVRDQKKIRRILERAAMVDGLTGIYNRKTIEEQIEAGLRTSGVGLESALLIIDLDDFKQINDWGGHHFGDTVLRACAQRLNDLFGTDGVVGRVGGDEFVVFLRDGRDAGWIAERVDGLIQNFYVPTASGELRKISVSVGVAHAGQGAETFLDLYQLADAALYRAKQSGKARLSD